VGAGSGSGSDEERDAYIVCARCYVVCITHALGHLRTCQEGSVEEQEVCVCGCCEMCGCVGACGWLSVVVGSSWLWLWMQVGVWVWVQMWC